MIFIHMGEKNPVYLSNSLFFQKRQDSVLPCFGNRAAPSVNQITAFSSFLYTGAVSLSHIQESNFQFSLWKPDKQKHNSHSQNYNLDHLSPFPRHLSISSYFLYPQSPCQHPIIGCTLPQFWSPGYPQRSRQLLYDFPASQIQFQKDDSRQRACLSRKNYRKQSQNTACQAGNQKDACRRQYQKDYQKSPGRRSEERRVGA